MSHFTCLKTNIINDFYLELVLKRFELDYYKSKSLNEECGKYSLVTFTNNYLQEIKFNWNGQEYQIITELTLGKSFEKVKDLIRLITQKYVTIEVIFASKKKNFILNMEKENLIDNSNKLLFERFTY